VRFPVLDECEIRKLDPFGFVPLPVVNGGDRFFLEGWNGARFINFRDHERIARVGRAPPTGRLRGDVAVIALVGLNIPGGQRFSMGVAGRLVTSLSGPNVGGRPESCEDQKALAIRGQRSTPRRTTPCVCPAWARCKRDCVPQPGIAGGTKAPPGRCSPGMTGWGPGGGTRNTQVTPNCRSSQSTNSWCLSKEYWWQRNPSSRPAAIFWGRSSR